MSDYWLRTQPLASVPVGRAEADPSQQRTASQGAADFRRRPVGARALIDRLEVALAVPESPTAPQRSAEPAPTDFCGFIGRSPPMLALYEQIRRIAPSRAPVFITGESGTGKELCAEAIHALADTQEPARPFVAINCSAIPRDLMESGIFGHVRGAFTGATENRAGAAELADGGTLFLDEIAEMDIGLQAKLLRFLDTGSVRRVGGSNLKRVVVRIVCATNREPASEVAAGRLRADLYYRLHVLPIHLPPLRDRGDDIGRLAEVFLARFSAEEGRGFHRLDEEAARHLRCCSWPGNVRELANVIRRIVVLHDGDTVTGAMLPEPDSGDPAFHGNTEFTLATSPVRPLQEEERQVIENALAVFDGNVARAAAALELSPSTLYRKRQSWPVEPSAGGPKVMGHDAA